VLSSSFSNVHEQETINSPEGWQYVGQIKNGKANGKGIYTWDGDKYEGICNLRYGKGIYYYNDKQLKGDKYEGDWKDDKRNGKGIYTKPNGKIFDGVWKNDKFIGK